MRSIQDRKAASAVQKLRSNARREPLSESFTHAIRILDIPLVERWTLVLAPAKSLIIEHLQSTTVLIQAMPDT